MRPYTPLQQAQYSQDARSTRRAAILSVGLRTNLVGANLPAGPTSDLPPRTRKAALAARKAIEAAPAPAPAPAPHPQPQACMCCRRRLATGYVNGQAVCNRCAGGMRR